MQKLIWGKSFLPLDAGTEHFLVVGATGSGKTTLIARLLKSVLQSPGADKRRALIYDSKQDFFSRLSHPELKLNGRLRILHPFDERCCAWDIAQDIDDPLSARQMATILIPQEEGDENNSFFINAARDLLTAVLLAFINCIPNAQSWTLRDVILALLYEPYLRYILSLPPLSGIKSLPMLDRVRETYLAPTNETERGADPRTASNIRATLNSALSVYEPVAAAWFEAWNRGEESRLSLRKWVTSNQILVLGNDESSRSALDPINQAIFRRLAELTLALPELKDEDKVNGEGQTWFFLDEVREAGELEGLSRLMTKGRSKGACIVLGFQDIDGLRAVYGTEIANEITGQCGNMAILKLNSPSTAEWAIQLYGEKLEILTTDNLSSGSNGTTIGSSETHMEKTSIYTRTLLTLPLAHKEYGLTGYFKFSDDGDKPVEAKHLDWQKHVKPYLLERSTASDFEPRSLQDRYLLPWDAKDWNRLGFAGSPPAWTARLDQSFLNADTRNAVVFPDHTN